MPPKRTDITPDKPIPAPSLKIEDIRSISNGEAGDPFAFLGLHQTAIDGAKGGRCMVIRTFQPQARRVAVIPDRGAPAEAHRISDDGLFELTFPRRKKPFDYELEIEPWQGNAYRASDPYRFGPMLSPFDLQLWGEGSHMHAYRWMGAHEITLGGVKGTRFVVSAPAARRVSVVGSFNDWDGRRHPMRKHHEQGLWELFIPGVAQGDLYKYEILPASGGPPMLKADPYGRFAELRPGTASKVWTSGFEWTDGDWLAARARRDHHHSPISVYEVHAGSWRRDPDHPDRFLTYDELARDLIPYAVSLGYTHIELMPMAEHPYDPSWGYQITGYFAPTSRFGDPDGFRRFVNACHEAGIGVILDWVPAHFTKDDHGLRRFDGTALYEHDDPRQGEHRDWGTLIFNFGRTEVLNFLLSNAVYWLEEFHIDGLRVDAVASMLYLDYSRKDGEWVPNIHGGRENLEAIHFLQRFNTVVHDLHPGVLTFAEESTSWQGVSRPVHHGGLGFDFKWNMGWMNDTLRYMERDPVHRKYHHGELTFSMIYAFSENFMLPFSHDEVVHMKQSMLSKMPGDDWQAFANLRLLLSYQAAHPGKKLLFMGAEFGQWSEWTEAHSLDWHLLQWDRHQGVQRLVRDLNTLYAALPALHELDHSWEGFQWIDLSDADNSLLSFIRRGRNPEDHVVVVLNFTPTLHFHYRIGVPDHRTYEVALNSDSEHYGGGNSGQPAVAAEPVSWHDQPASVRLTIPPLACIILKPA